MTFRLSQLKTSSKLEPSSTNQVKLRLSAPTILTKFQSRNWQPFTQARSNQLKIKWHKMSYSQLGIT
jgi:hypothetical protein